MAEINVTITEQVNPSVTINTIASSSLSQSLSANSNQLSSLNTATGVLSSKQGQQQQAILDLEDATGLLNTATGALDSSFSGLLVDADLKNLTVTGDTTFNKTVNIFPPQGRAITARATNSNNAAIQVVFEGPTTVGHDLFKKGGFTNGFGDGSNHFHDLTDINRIEQAPEGDVKNLERVQERYYAITNNNLANGNAAFWAWHRVARKISTSNVDTSSATLDVSALQNSSNRNADSQKPFRFNTSPSRKSEEIVITLNGHSFSDGDTIRMIFGQSFEGPIVAAGLFGVIVSSTTNTINVELYGGNYKTTSEVPLGTNQTALSFDFVTLQSIGTDTLVQNNNKSEFQHYANTNFTPNRLRNNTVKVTWTSDHGLKKNETVMIITDGRASIDGSDGLEIKQGGYVLDPDPDGDGNSAIIAYGRRVDTIDISPFSAFGNNNWSIHKGSIDGIHDDTLGDNLFNFNANNVGEYKQYQIGPGCETDADCISIGKNVYNRDASTIKIGYDNQMLDIRSDGVVVDGSISLNAGDIQPEITAPSTGTALGGSVVGNDIRIDAGTTAGNGSTGGNLFLNGGKALQVAGQTVTDGKVSIGADHTEKLEITPNTDIFGNLNVSGEIATTGIIRSNKLNVSTGKLFVDDDSTNYSVKIGAYGQGTFFGKDGTENGAQYTLAVGTGGKICEDLRVQTFKISGDGFLNLNASPKTLIATPGVGKAIRVHDICFYVDHNGNKGVGAGGFDQGSEACYNVGIHSDTTYASNEQFYAMAGLPRNVLNSEPGDFIWAGEPDDDFRVLPNRALLLKSPATNEITTSNTAAKPGGAHYIKIRYQILNLSSDFQNVANLTTITS